MPSRRKSRRTSSLGQSSPSTLPGDSEGMRDVDVLLFPSDASSPRIVHVNYRIQNGAEESHIIDWKPLLGQDAAFTSQPVGQIEMHAGMLLTRSRLYLAFNDCFAIDGSPVNRCAQQLTGGCQYTEWRGNLVGYRAREPAETLTQFVDVSMDDLAAFVRFLKNHGSPFALESERDAWTERSNDCDEWAFMRAIPIELHEYVNRLEEGEKRTPNPGPPPDYTRGYTTGRRGSAASSEPLRSAAPVLTREDVRRMIWEELLRIAWTSGCGYMAWRFLLLPGFDALYRVWGVKTLLSFLWFMLKGLVVAMFAPLAMLLAGIVLVPLGMFIVIVVFGCCLLVAACFCAL